MGTTPNLGLPYPAPSDAPDAPGAFYALATGVDNALANTALPSFATVAGSFAFDSGNGVNSVIAIGKLRIVSFSIFNGSGFTSTAPFMTMKTGHRPAANVFAGVQVGDNGANVTGVAAVTATGDCYLSAWIPDQLSDAKAQSVRGTFTYWQVG